MEAGFVVLAVAIALIVGILVGISIGKAKKIASESRGVLYVDREAPEGQGLFLEQLVPASVVASEKRVMFDVVVIK